jgi:hypothetical protein
MLDFQTITDESGAYDDILEGQEQRFVKRGEDERYFWLWAENVRRGTDGVLEKAYYLLMPKGLKPSVNEPTTSLSLSNLPQPRAQQEPDFHRQAPA